MIAEIATSNSTQYALLANGQVYAWGQGTDGQLGNGRGQNSFTTAVRVRFPAGVKIASIPTDTMPFDSGLAIDTRGHAWGWGLDTGGEFCLGDGGLASSRVAVRVKGLAGSSVTALTANSGAVLRDGKYYDWGFDGEGELGDGTNRQAVKAPVRVPLPGAVTQAVEGGSLAINGQTLVKLADGALFAWGAGGEGQTGDGSKGTAMKPVLVESGATGISSTADDVAVSIR
jgi:alpha-tubulin suppressor-like RCC1 family protein